MSSSIWTRCAGDSELRSLRLSPWRVVEAQHQLSTRKLVDSAEEQILLEELIHDDAKAARCHPRRASPLSPVDALSISAAPARLAVWRAL